MSRQLKAVGEDIWKNKTQEKINSELFTLTYGSIVSQLCSDFQNDYEEVNKQLFQMGYNIGVRLIDEFLSTSQLSRCTSFKETGEVVSKVAFKMFLNITPNVEFDNSNFDPTQNNNNSSNNSSSINSNNNNININNNSSSNNINNNNNSTNGEVDAKSFTLIFDENPLSDFVELPMDPNSNKLWYSNVLCGILKGSLEMIQLDTKCYFVSDVLRGDEVTALRVDLVQVLKDEIPAGDE